jgi:hypothetical protein
MRRMTFVAGLLLVASGCAAARTEIQILSADRSVAQAADQDAATLSPYEYTLSERYLAKAKEEAGYANYRDALTLARKAAVTADQALINVEKSGKKQLPAGDALDTPEDAPAAPIEAPVEPAPGDAPEPQEAP